ncbi:bifunctional helix-turn-helix domain-containing protein/methylated-DNA--[protein]-cysteine S-methyltransferase [Pedobacter sp. N23S346]|uniref:bifunctional helix-turn-helix domain-containing protein/methylated-DNA--[protein]-cysteine S-methyltransferase n=1 Tax=Pedobacter sp. N23S346 TaxID=3402750 RepID=UPI003AD0DA85
MKAQEEINFTRITEAINFIQLNFKSQPSLEEIAEKANLSPYHFQRLFSEWAGTSPKRFLQYISIGYAKKCLKENQASLFETALETGLSGTSRLHDLFVNIEGMTPGEYKNGGENLVISYSFAETPFGTIIVASTLKGICHLVFSEEEEIALMQLKAKFPAANFIRRLDPIQQNALLIFQNDWTKLNQVKLHLKGTAFQLKVWETLLKIPMGKLSTYGNIARKVDNPKASRAVGTAIGDNPVAFLIPCHRVIQASGALGGYHWGTNRKTAIIGWEAAKTETDSL